MKAAVRARNTSDWNLTSSLALYPLRSQGICLQCRLRAVAALRSKPSVTYLPPSSRRYASESIGSRIKSTIWGPAAKNAPKDAPKDAPKATPEASVHEVEAVREAELPEMGIEHTDQLEEELFTSLPEDPPADYKPASNAYGLPHTGDFQAIPKDPERRYKR